MRPYRRKTRGECDANNGAAPEHLAHPAMPYRFHLFTGGRYRIRGVSRTACGFCRGGYQPPAVHPPQGMFGNAGASYLAEAAEQVIEESGSDNG